MLIEEELKQANCTEPFEFLGKKTIEELTQFNVWLPGAKNVSVFDLDSGKNIGKLKRKNKTDLFCGQFKQVKDNLVYALKVETKDSH